MLQGGYPVPGDAAPRGFAQPHNPSSKGWLWTIIGVQTCPRISWLSGAVMVLAAVLY